MHFWSPNDVNTGVKKIHFPKDVHIGYRYLTFWHSSVIIFKKFLQDFHWEVCGGASKEIKNEVVWHEKNRKITWKSSLSLSFTQNIVFCFIEENIVYYDIITLLLLTFSHINLIQILWNSDNTRQQSEKWFGIFGLSSINYVFACMRSF